LATVSQQLRRDLMLEAVEALNRQLRRLEPQLSPRAQHTPAVARLRGIPGVGIRTAEAVAAFVDDPDRFRNAKAVGRLFGLVRCQDQSGGRNRLGHLLGVPVNVVSVAAATAWGQWLALLPIWANVLDWLGLLQVRVSAFRKRSTVRPRKA
jgi:transposase